MILRITTVWNFATESKNYVKYLNITSAFRHLHVLQEISLKLIFNKILISVREEKILGFLIWFRLAALLAAFLLLFFSLVVKRNHWLFILSFISCTPYKVFSCNFSLSLILRSHSSQSHLAEICVFYQL